MGENVTVIDGVFYREVERKANVGERIVIVRIGKKRNMRDMTVGRTYTVVDAEGFDIYGEVDVIDDAGDTATANVGCYRVLVPVEPDNSAAIIDGLTETYDKLVQTVANLTLRVIALEHKSDVVAIAESIAKLSGMERKVECESAPKTVASQLTEAFDALARKSPLSDGIFRKDRRAARERSLSRDEIVESAKKDVATLEVTVKSAFNGYSGVSFWPKECEKDGYVPCHYVEYEINRDKGTVKALIRFLPELDVKCAIDYEGTTVCAPDDCFNVHIGKAIALRRALGLDVPEYYGKAPQPTEVRVGDIVTFKDGTPTIYRVDSLSESGRNCTIIKSEDYPEINGILAHGGKYAWARIIDDSRDESGGDR